MSGLFTLVIIRLLGKGRRCQVMVLSTFEITLYNLLRIDLDGWIELTTDGEHTWVEVEMR